MKTSAIPQSKNKERNLEKYGDNSNSCICCGKPTGTNLFVHMTTDWQMVNEGDEKKVGNSQGFFPIGRECSKLIENEFVFKK